MSATTRRALELESRFEPGEMFFSRTDRRGIIISGNGTFSRIAKYRLSEMLSRSHNIVRHPDMPRTVFKILWEGIAAGRTISAYVKNRASDGSYYWVFATVYPCADGYLSIRYKPTGNLLPEVKRLYAELVQVEAREGKGDRGLEQAQKLLLDRLSGLGFRDYEQFMRHAMNQEIKCWNRLMASEQDLGFGRTADNDQVGSLLLLKEEAGFEVFRRFDDVAEGVRSIGTLLGSIRSAFEQVWHFSMNLSLHSSKLGPLARPLLVVAETFGGQTHSIKEMISSLDRELGSISSDSLAPIEYDFASILLQSAMLRNFYRARDEEEVSPELSRLRGEDLAILNQLSSDLEDRLSASFRAYRQKMRFFRRILESFETQIGKLHVVHQIGKVECSRIPGDVSSILFQLASLNSLVIKTMDDLRSASNALKMAEDRFASLDQGLSQIFGLTTTVEKFLRISAGTTTNAPAA